MKNTNVELPESYRDIMITYKKTFYFGAYRSESREEIVTKRGFYSNLFNNFAVPPEYRKFKGVLLPHGFGGDKLSISQIIKWEYCE